MDDAKHHTWGPASGRSKTMELRPVGEDRFEFAARLTDTATDGNFPDRSVVIHDFVAGGVVSGSRLILEQLEIRAIEHPYPECPFVLPATDALVGSSLLGGWRRRVLDQLGGTGGCTHVNTLLLGLAELNTMVIFQRMNQQVPYTPESRAEGHWIREGLRVEPHLEGACFGLRPDGAAVGTVTNVEPGEPRQR